MTAELGEAVRGDKVLAGNTTLPPSFVFPPARRLLAAVDVRQARVIFMASCTDRARPLPAPRACRRQHRGHVRGICGLASSGVVP